MAIVHLAPNVDVSRCPNCAGPMSEPIRGRHTRKWFRHCRSCVTTTATEDAPIASAPREYYRSTSLPFTRVGAITQPDFRSLAAGEREPGEDG